MDETSWLLLANGHNAYFLITLSWHLIYFEVTKKTIIICSSSGRKSYMRAPTKLASAVAYPFDFIKPCEVRGDVTLEDINQKIRTPPASNSKQGQDDTPPCYPTSAFSGKPVVGKTKIPTQGGKGSITIMRTKG